MKTKKQLRKLIKNDNDFINFYDKEKRNSTFKHAIKNLQFNFDLKKYIIDKPYLDISWVKINNKLYNLDSIYFDFKNVLSEL